jgi:uncharacterized RDD family membrane protein YckC
MKKVNISTNADFWKRGLAFLIDIILLRVVILVLSSLFRTVLLNLGQKLWYIDFIIFGLYFVLFNSKVGKGQTLGRRLLGIRIVGENGKFLTFSQSFFRYIFLSFLIFNRELSMIDFFIPPLIISLFLLISIVGLLIFNKDKRGLHDYLVKSVVINSNSLNDIKIVKIEKFSEAIVNHKVAFISVIILFIILVLLVSFIGNVVSNGYARMRESNSINTEHLNLSNYLNENTVVSNIYVSSFNNSLKVTGYLKYSIYNDEEARNKQYQEVYGLVLSSYPSISNYDDLTIIFRTGYTLHVTKYYLSERKVFPINID